MMNKCFIIILLAIIIPISSKANSLVESLSIGDRQPINEPISSYDTTSNSYPDPFSEDEIIFTITSENYQKFSENLLTEGQIEMFKSYPETFQMNVYESRRSCSVPPEVIALTKSNATLTDDGEGIEGVVGSIPFPKPSEALHHVWNHILRYRGVEIKGSSPFFIVNSDGSRVLGAGEAIAKNFWNPFI